MNSMVIKNVDEKIAELEAINKALLNELQLMQIKYSFSDHYERKLKLAKAIETLSNSHKRLIGGYDSRHVADYISRTLKELKI